jgi:tetratricopeptide (TPR) repeat protein
MESAIAWSYEFLNPEEQTVFRRLSVFAGSFDPDSAQEVAEPGHEDLLDSLADKSLIQREHFDTAPRYKMLGIIQEYARERLKDVDDVAEIQRRYMRYFLFAAIEHLGHLSPGDEEQAHPWIRREIANLRAVLDHSVETNTDLGLQVGVLLRPYWLDMGYVTEGRDRLARLINASQPTMTLLGKEEPRQSWLSSAIDMFGGRERSLEDGPWIEVPHFWRTDALQLAAVLASVQNDYDAARPYLQEVWDLGERFGDKRLVQAASLPLAALAKKESKFGESFYYKTLGEKIEEVDHERHNAYSLAAVIAMRRKDLVEAKNLTERAYDSAPPSDQTLRIGMLVQLAYIAELEGKTSEAIGLCTRAEDAAIQTGVAIVRGNTLLMTGRIYEGLGRAYLPLPQTLNRPLVLPSTPEFCGSPLPRPRELAKRLCVSENTEKRGSVLAVLKPSAVNSEVLSFSEMLF